jgi:hypothetical protein
MRPSSDKVAGIRERGTLDYSYRKGRPLLGLSDFPYVPVWNPIGAEWLATLAKTNRFWARACKDPFTGGQVAAETPEAARIRITRLLAFRDALLAVAGDEVCLPSIEEDIDLIERYGEFWMGRGVTLKRGEPCSCHSNSLWCWDANRDRVAAATGYALSEDGMWRQHSWCVLRATAGKGGRVVETTVKRVLYFGLSFTPAESEARLTSV